MRAAAKSVEITSEELDVKEASCRPGVDGEVVRVRELLRLESEDVKVPARLMSAWDFAVASRPGTRSVRTLLKRAVCAGASPEPAVRTSTPTW